MLKLPDNKLVRFLLTALIFGAILLVFGLAEVGILWTVDHFFGKTTEHIVGWGLSALVFGYMAWTTANPKPKKVELPLTPFQAQAVADRFRAKGYPAAADSIEQLYGLPEAEARAKAFAEENDRPSHIG